MAGDESGGQVAVHLPGELPVLSPTAARILLAILAELTTIETLERGNDDDRDCTESVGDAG